RSDPGVARATEALILLIDEPVWIGGGDLPGLVRGAVVHDDHFEGRIIQMAQGLQCGADRRRAVVRAHDHGDLRPSEVGGKRPRREGLRHGLEGGLRRPIAGRQAERPILDPVLPVVPFIRPCEDDDTDAAAAESPRDLRLEHCGLSLFSPAKAVEPNLREQDGTVVAQAVQPREIVLEGIPRLEVDVEAKENQERQPQVFGRRVVHIRDQGIRILLLDNPVQAFDESFDATASVPSDDRRGDLISDNVTEHRGMARARSNPGPDPSLDLFDPARLVEESHMLAPVESDHDPELVLPRRIQEPTRRRGVDAHDVEAARRHLRKVPLHRLRRETLLPVFVHVEGTIADAANPELLGPEEEELPLDCRTSLGELTRSRNLRWPFGDCHLSALGTLVSYQEIAATSEHNETSSGYTESPMLNMIGQDCSVRRRRARCVVPGGDEPYIARWGP